MAQFVNARYEMFKSQNQENGYFDLKFKVQEKTIYAHKFMLATVSEVLKAMISDTWNNGDSIKIQTYSYNDFYDFLYFLYSGECKINDENIFTMVDLSEFYQVESLQQKCDEFLSQKQYTSENILLFFEKLSNFSLPLFEKTLSKLFKEKRINLVESEGFLKLPKEMIKKIVGFEDRFVSEEKLFEKVYEWAENRVLKKQGDSKNENFNMNDEIKTEITEFLPYIQFKKMNLKFLHKFVVKRGFLFTYDELSDILDNANTNVKVKVSNAYVNSIFCILPSNSNIVQNVKSLKNCSSDVTTHQHVYWAQTFTKPSTPRQCIKRPGVEWYLVSLHDGQICVMNHSSVKVGHHLIAEMTAETSGFESTPNCKIEIE